MNLICICLDTFRADIVGNNGKMSFVKTPNLDALARDSVCFDRAFGEGQPTLQIRRAMFTGRRSFPWRYNFDRRGHWHHASGWHKIPPEQDTIAEMLLSRGYMTCLVADTYHMFKSTMNYVRGFAAYDFIRGQESDNLRAGNGKQIEENLKQHVREPVNWRRHGTLIQYLLNMQDRKSEDDYLCARVFQSASRYLEDMKDCQPFFMWVDSFDPHEPWDPPKAYADKYCPDYSGKDFIMPGAAYEDGQPADEEKERIKALYFGEATFVDKWVGHLLNKIDELKLWDDTIVMLTCDHGTQIMDHGSFGKGANKLHPFNTRIMWYVKHPDGPKDKHINGFVQSHDIVPTMMYLLGHDYICDGMNVWPLVTGETDTLRDHVVTGWAGWSNGPALGRASVRDDEWNYTVEVGQPEKNPELFHLPSDPDERNNVINHHPDVVTRQKDRLEAVLGHPLPAVQNEVCDSNAPPPGVKYRAMKYDV
ncbi:sulfatase-like hydrolase/transferase [Candidatus Poribacteria bacterium]|nr:sulfatase-like hydrolase/transferase [Candidatus Poribacteria bacterium]